MAIPCDYHALFQPRFSAKALKLAGLSKHPFLLLFKYEKRQADDVFFLTKLKHMFVAQNGYSPFAYC